MTTKTNPFFIMNKLRTNNYKEVDKQTCTFALMSLYSTNFNGRIVSNPANHMAVLHLNKFMSKYSLPVVQHMLHYMTDRQRRYQFMKQSLKKVEDKFDFLADEIMRYLQIGKQDYEDMKEVVEMLMEDKEWCKTVDELFGFEKKFSKRLGLKIVEPKKELYVAERTQKSIGVF